MGLGNCRNNGFLLAYRCQYFDEEPGVSERVAFIYSVPYPPRWSLKKVRFYPSLISIYYYYLYLLLLLGAVSAALVAQEGQILP